MRRDNNWIEKGVDMLLGIDLLRHATNNLYDTAILVSGDGDFIHAVQAVKDTEKDVEVAFFENLPVNVCGNQLNLTNPLNL